MASLFSQVHTFNKNKLKATNTVVRHNVFISPEANKGYSGDENKTEYFDDPKELRAKVKRLALLIKNSKHFVIYTGAGISTSAELPDYRGPNGMWTLADKGLQQLSDVDVGQAKPTFCHMAVVSLLKAGILKYLVSTNTDGLHVRSGFPREQLAEVHGNCFIEFCEKCGREYLRNFVTTTNVKRPEHWTGRKCDCGGRLYDNIVGFGENLPEQELLNAEKQSKLADLSLVLGSSMRVNPSCRMPTYACAINKGNMVICNLQKTDYDDKASFIIRAYTDDLLFLLLQELGLGTTLQTPGGGNIKFQVNIDEKYQALSQTDK